MANIFKEAKKIHRMHPRLDWQECIQRASKKHKPKKVGAAKKKKKNYRQTGTSNKSYDVQRSARPPGARIPRGGKKVTYYERRKNRTDVPGKLTGISDATLKSVMKDRLKDKLSKKLLKKTLATGVRERKKYSKEAAEVKRNLLKLG